MTKETIIIEEITITLERKNIKNMYLKILPPEGEVKVSAPLFLSDEDIFNFIINQVSPESQKILEITAIKVEYAPIDEKATEEPFTKCYLNDRTSFDTYI